MRIAAVALRHPDNGASTVQGAKCLLRQDQSHQPCHRVRHHRDRWGRTLVLTSRICDRYAGGAEYGGRVAGPIRAFLCDDHELVRRGVKDLLEADGDIVVVGEAANKAEALLRVPLVRPVVAVLDVRLPDGNGVALCRELRSMLPHLNCLMLTSFADDEALLGAVMAGAAGYVLKQIRGSDLVGAVRTVAAGGSLLDPVATAQLMARLRDQTRPNERLAGLSDQERRVLDLIGEGLTNRQIGQRMSLAEQSVKNYVTTVLAKLGLERRTQAAVYVHEFRASIDPSASL